LYCSTARNVANPTQPEGGGKKISGEAKNFHRFSSLKIGKSAEEAKA